MEKQESFKREIEGFKLTIVLNSKKLIVRAVERDTNNLYACEFKAGQLPQDIKFVYENEEGFFEALISEENIRISKEKLIIGYKIFPTNQVIQRQFSIPLIKMEVDQFQSMQRKLAILESQVQKISSIEAELEDNKRILQMLQKRTQFYFYRPGVFKPFAFDTLTNPQYKIREKYLSCKPVQIGSRQQLLAVSLISGEPIDQRDSLVSYKVVVTDVAKQQTQIFIGICTRKGRQQSQFGSNQSYSAINKDYTCLGTSDNKKGYYSKVNQWCFERNSKSRQLIKVSIGDVIVLTVNNQNYSLTLFKNQVSWERFYFQKPSTSIYPFIYLDANTEVSF